MRAVVLLMMLALALSAPAQQPTQSLPQPPPAGSNWQHVQALPAEASIHVNIISGSTVCSLKSVDDQILTCTHGQKDLIFQRSQIKSIKLARRYRSTWIGIAIGGATGIVAVEAAYKPTWDYPPVINRGSVAAIVGVPLAIVGGIVGHFTDFTGFTIYKAP